MSTEFPNTDPEDPGRTPQKRGFWGSTSNKVAAGILATAAFVTLTETSEPVHQTVCGTFIGDFDSGPCSWIEEPVYKIVETIGDAFEGN